MEGMDEGQEREVPSCKGEDACSVHGTNDNLDSGQEGTLSGLREIRAVGLINPSEGWTAPGNGAEADRAKYCS
jgi:hypothetical protein